MRVMFIQPPMPQYGVCTLAPYPALGQALIAAYLDEDCEVKQLDGLAHPELFEDENLRKEIEQFKPDVVGIRVMFINYFLAMKAANYIKSIRTEVFIAVGGPHASLLGAEILEDNPCVDVVMYGEGEKSFTDIINHVCNRDYQFVNVSGVYYRDAGKITYSGNADYIELGEKLPRYEILDMDFYKKINFMTIEGRRGCVNNCIFCGLPKIQGNKNREKEVCDVMKEIETVYYKYGITKMEFVEPNFTINKKWVESLCDEIISKGIKMQFVCRTYVELVDKEILKKMKQAGFMQIFYGIESGSQKILDEYKRPATVQESIDAVKWTKEVGIRTSVNFLVGAPGETRETVKESIQLARKIKVDDADISILAPFPNTEFYNHESVHLIDKQWYKKMEYVSRFPWFVAYYTDTLSARELQELWLEAVDEILGVYKNA